MLEMNKRDSIYIKLVEWIVIAAVAAGVLFWALNTVGVQIIDSYYYSSEYVDRQNSKYINRFQDYVTENQLTTMDSEKITSWIKKQGVVSIQIYNNNILVYDSDYPDQITIIDENIAAEAYSWNEYYTVMFADAETLVSISGIYDYQIYNIFMIIELLVSFFVFLLLIILGIRKKMSYIRRLSNEIEILEGGNLNYAITIKGKDELALLATGLDCMRRSFQEKVIQEVQMVQENQRIITEMSHDLRTPITSVMLYTEILKKGAYKNDAQLLEYLEKINKKSRRMKQLTDNLFEYSLVTGDVPIQMEPPEVYEVLFYDLFSETYSYLSEKGFQVEFKVQWVEESICICQEYLTRIMDNITSNILKYADKESPITIASVQEKGMAGFSFKNKYKNLNEKVDSSGIGIQSIKNMMSKMGGRCNTEKDAKTFRITILFPCCAHEETKASEEKQVLNGPFSSAKSDGKMAYFGVNAKKM